MSPTITDGIEMGKEVLTNATALGAASSLWWMPLVMQVHQTVLVPVATLVGTAWIIYQFIQRVRSDTKKK